MKDNENGSKGLDSDHSKSWSDKPATAASMAPGKLKRRWLQVSKQQNDETDSAVSLTDLLVMVFQCYVRSAVGSRTLSGKTIKRQCGPPLMIVAVPNALRIVGHTRMETETLRHPSVRNRRKTRLLTYR